MWMVSSLALAACGGDLGTESASEPQVMGAQQELGAAEDPASKRIIVYLTPDNELYMRDKMGNPQLVAKRSSAPVWSPDARRVAFSKLPDSWRPGNPVVRADLHVINLASRHVERLTHGHDDLAQVWSPDGRRLLFSSSRRTRVPSMFRVDVNSGHMEQVTNVPIQGDSEGVAVMGVVPNPADAAMAHWEPSLQKRIIVYDTARSADGEVLVLRFDRTLNVEKAYSLGQGYDSRWTDWGTVMFKRQASGQRGEEEVEVSVE